MNRKRILVVDDDRVVLRALSVRLNAEGYEVLTAEDGAGGVNSAHRDAPDLILLDINFPPDVANGGGVAWDGYLILNWLSRMEEAKGIPVIMMTQDDPAIHKDRAMKAGVKGLFGKPLDIDALLSVVRQLAPQPEMAA